MARNSTTATPATKNDDKVPAAGALKPPARSYKGTPTVLRKSVTNSQSSPISANGQLQVFADATKSNDIILRLEMANGQPPFVWHTWDKLIKDPDFTRTKLGIDQVHNRVSPSDPRTYKTYPVSGGRERQWVILVKIVRDGEENTAATRRRLAENFVHFYNHPDNQRQYKYAMRAYFAGDTTPQDASTAQPLSKWLTINDTMAVMQEAIAPDEDDLAARRNNTQDDTNVIPISSVLRHDDALRDYYMPEHYALALQDFAGSGADTAVSEQSGAFAGLPDFSFT